MSTGIQGVGKIIAVASGKGGVGKSSVAMNLAAALSAAGKKVGLLDADIYGPSAPLMAGLRGAQPENRDEKTFMPLAAHGVKIMSMGFMLEESTPVVWRAPMVISALRQLLRQTDWGTLDVLVVDMPPGTGDIQLSMAQEVPLSGAIIVSTPQDMALADARRAVSMLRKVNVPILGVVENMSLFICPNCGHQAHIFSHGGAAEEAGKMSVPLLAEIPLNQSFREATDTGRPVVINAPDTDHAAIYRQLAEKTLHRLEDAAVAPDRVKVVFEENAPAS